MMEGIEDLLALIRKQRESIELDARVISVLLNEIESLKEEISQLRESQKCWASLGTRQDCAKTPF